MSPSDYETMGVEPDVTIDGLKARYRVLALELHPDRGGDPVRFNLVCQAYGRLSEKLANPKARPCVNCRGRRKVSQARGFNSIAVPCPECQQEKAR